MKSTGASFVAVLALSLLAGCGEPEVTSNAPVSPVGVYELDSDAMKAAMFALPVRADMDAMSRQLRETMLSMITEMSGTMRVEADGTLTLAMQIPRAPNIEPKAGTWQFDGVRMLITMPNAEGVPETRPAMIRDGVIAIPVDQGGQQIEMLWRRDETR